MSWCHNDWAPAFNKHVIIKRSISQGWSGSGANQFKLTFEHVPMAELAVHRECLHYEASTPLILTSI